MADKKKSSSVKLYSGADENFEKGCKGANIPLTKRQYKKWQKKEGLAYRFYVENKGTNSL